MKDKIISILKDSLKSGIIGVGISLVFFFSFSGFLAEGNITLMLFIYMIFGYIAGVLIPFTNSIVVWLLGEYLPSLVNNIISNLIITYIVSASVFYLTFNIFLKILGLGIYGTTIYVSLGVGIASVMIRLFYNYYEEQEKKLALEQENRKLAVVEERNRIARELHDSVSQNLFGISLNLNTLPAIIRNDTEKGIEMIEQLQEMVQEVQTEMRLMIYELRPLNLTEKGFFEAMESMISLFRRRYELDISCQLSGEEDNLNSNEQLVLYRVVQELLNNVVKHAAADRVKMGISIESERTILRVKDNGIGFKPESIDSEKSFGLMGIKERLAEVGGELTINSNPGQGAEMVVHI